MRNDPLIPMLGVVTMIRTDTPDVKTFRVTGIDGTKISLSMKRLEPKPQKERPANTSASRRDNGSAPQSRPARTAPPPPPAPKTADQLFEEKLKQFMNESNTKISSIRQYSDHRTKSRRR